MTDTTTTATGTETSQQDGQQGQQQEGTFTQADLDAYAAKVRGEERRKASEKFSDYDELKTKAAGAKTLEERLGSMEIELGATKLEALRSQIASEYGISTKRESEDNPSDAEVILTGATREAMTAQATRFAGALAASKTSNKPVARNEGVTKSTGASGEQEARAFARDLFGSGD